MRLVPGNEVTVAQQSITSRLLVNMGVIDPDMMTTIFSMYPEMAPLTALLDAKNYKTEGINYGTTGCSMEEDSTLFHLTMYSIVLPMMIIV